MVTVLKTYLIINEIGKISVCEEWKHLAVSAQKPYNLKFLKDI